MLAGEAFQLQHERPAVTGVPYGRIRGAGVGERPICASQTAAKLCYSPGLTLDGCPAQWGSGRAGCEVGLDVACLLGLSSRVMTKNHRMCDGFLEDGLGGDLLGGAQNSLGAESSLRLSLSHTRGLRLDRGSRSPMPKDRQKMAVQIVWAATYSPTLEA